ncbi:MAG: chromate reductase [Chlamydiales bacterium]
MTQKAKLLAFSGSARKASFNKKILKTAVQGAKDAGAEVTIVDLADFPMPLYNGDLEATEGLPENAKKFKKLMIESDGFLIAAPEYNSSITPLLKNAIDWVSRPEDGEASLIAFKGKVAALMSASPGGFGGLRGLVHVRAILGNIHVLVIPDQVAVPVVHEALNEDGSFKDQDSGKSVADLGKKLTEIVTKLKRDPLVTSG